MPQLSGKKVLFVICQENFRDEELAHPREEVARAGAKTEGGARDAGKVVGGICLSGATLAVAGVLKGVEATCYVTDASKKEMQKGGAIFVEKPVVVSGKIVTASGPPAARDFGKALVTALSKG